MVQCPDDNCSYESSERGIKLHHKRTHGESLAKENFVCDFCDDSFEEYSCNREGHENIFCSPECLKSFRREQSDVDWYHICDNCGDEFRRHPHLIKKHDKQFCDKKCNTEYINENPEWFSWYKGGKQTVECSWCEEDVKRKPYEVERSQKYFCSQECFGLWRSENIVGQSHPRWKGGYKKYYGPTWRKQRKKALERDKYECQDCGMSQKKHIEQYDKQLEVHHQTPIRTFDDTEIANKLSNLVSLCCSCHSKREYNEQQSVLGRSNG